MPLSLILWAVFVKLNSRTMKKFVFAMIVGLMGPAALVSVSAQNPGPTGGGPTSEAEVTQILQKTSVCLAQQGQQVSVPHLRDQLDHGELCVEQVDPTHYRVADGGGMFDVIITDIP